MNKDINNIGLVGVGLVGSSWAAFYAAKGFAVKLYDANLSTCREEYESVVNHLGFLRDHEMLSWEEFEKAVRNLRTVDNLLDAVRQVEFVHESASERYEVKKEIFKQVDRHTSADVVVASSSSALLMTEIQKVMKHPERALIAHPFNPAHLIPLAELVAGRRTDPTIIAGMKDFFEAQSKIAIVARKEVPGYIANRLQAAVWREAIDIVLGGIADVEDVDKALYAGPGIRWALMGQNMIYHLAGGKGGIANFIDHIGENKKRLWKDIATWNILPARAKEVLVEGINEQMGDRKLEDLERWRDEKLIGLLKQIYG